MLARAAQPETVELCFAANTVSFDDLIRNSLTPPDLKVSSLSEKDRDPDRHTNPASLTSWPRDFTTDVNNLLDSSSEVQVCQKAKDCKLPVRP